jgi:hypothetical protein
MQHRAGGEAVIADDARADASDESSRSPFRLIAPGAALEPVVESCDAAVEGVELMTGRERLLSGQGAKQDRSHACGRALL